MGEIVHRTTLDNGLRVVAQRVPGVTGAGLAVNYRVGFRTESRSRSGFAHLFEHMMFQGSTATGRGEHFTTVLACGGAVNALTFPDLTDYHQIVPLPAMERVLELEADRMGFLAITQQNLDTQRDVVKEEIRMKVDSKPYGGFPWTVLPAVLYGKWENSHNGFGELDDLDAATVEDCAAFYDSYYSPGNAVLALCGDFDPHEAVATARRCFEHLPPRPVPDPADISEPVGSTPLRDTCYDSIAPRPAIAIGCRMPDASTDLDGYAAYVVLSHLLTRGTHARLRRALAPLGVQVASSTGFFGPLMARDPDTLVIVAHVPHDQTDNVVEVIDDRIADVAAGGGHGAEMDRAIATTLTSAYQSLDSVAHRVRFLARGELLFDRPTVAGDLAAAIKNTGADAVAAAAAAVARRDGRAVLTLQPTEDAT